MRAHPRNPRRARGRWPLQSAREEAPHQRATELRQAVLHDRPPENRLTNAWTASAVRGRTGDGAARGEEKNGRACGRPVERRIAAMDGPIIAQAPPLKMKMVLYIRLLLTRWQCVRCFVAMLFSEKARRLGGNATLGIPRASLCTREGRTSTPPRPLFGSDEWRSKLDIS